MRSKAAIAGAASAASPILIKNKQFEVSLRLNKSPRDNYVFTSFDRLQGTVVLTPLKKIACIDSIAILFEGFSKSVLPGDFSGVDFTKQLYGGGLGSSYGFGHIDNPLLQLNYSFLENNLNIECHKLVQVGQRLHGNDGAIEFLPGQHYEYPFEIMIPSETMCCLAGNEEEGIVHNRRCAKHNDTAFHVDSMTNTKVPLAHRKNLFLQRGKVLQYHLPPSTSAENIKNKSPLDSLCKIVYDLKVSVSQSSTAKGGRFTKAKKSVTNGYYEVKFLPRESSVDVCLRDKRASRILGFRSDKLFKISDAERAQCEKYKQQSLSEHSSADSSTNSSRYSSPPASPHSRYTFFSQPVKFKNNRLYNEKFKRYSDKLLYLELRLYDSDFFTPSSTPDMKLFLVSTEDPSKMRNLLNENDIVALRLQNLEIDLLESTRLKNQLSCSNASASMFNRMDQSEFITDTFVKKISLFQSEDWLNHEILLQCLQHDPLDRYNDSKAARATSAPLTKSRFVKSHECVSPITNLPVYECEIPISAFKNFSLNAPNENAPGIVVPENILPSFKTCNIKRDYKLAVKCEFESCLDSDYAATIRRGSAYFMQTGLGRSISSDSRSTCSSSNTSTNSLGNFTKKIALSVIKNPLSARQRKAYISGASATDLTSSKDLIYLTFAAKIRVLSGVSNLIEDHVVNNDLNYTIADIMDLAYRTEKLPIYDDICSNAGNGSNTLQSRLSQITTAPLAQTIETC